MKSWIRAEDFSLVGTRGVNLGGRMISAGNIVSFHIFKRLSLEIIGLCGVAAFALYLTASSQGNVAAWIASSLFISMLLLGVWREAKHSYVLVIQILQEGLFEVRGFTETDAANVQTLLSKMTVN